MIDAKYLELGWVKYIDTLTVNEDTCWVYFHGPHAFTAGVYVKGTIHKIDYESSTVSLRVRDFSTDAPLTDEDTNERIADVVSVKYRQVFLWPEEWNIVPTCDIASCKKRLCDGCAVWNELPVISPNRVNSPGGIYAQLVVPAYWIIPSRCYLPYEGKRPASWVRRVSHMFNDFKLGEEGYTYPLALGIFEALRRHNAIEFDAIVPIPLSPDKEKAGEVHRTRALATELRRLLGAPVREYLTLSEPVSKRRMTAAGYSASAFKQRYSGALRVDDGIQKLNHVLIVDDVITRGWTLGCATRAMHNANEALQITAAATGQMIMKAAVVDEADFVA